ncbi:MAG: hypothetical protein NTV57_16580 [Cyanobacteria bacterium]|nr:hypothetical protein [Cyanobacteriota bacterium]
MASSFVPETAVSTGTNLDLISFLWAIPEPRIRRGLCIPSWYLLVVVGLRMHLKHLTPGRAARAAVG